jgi:hypothetical protein
MRLNNPQKDLISDKLMDGANYALAGLVFGQLVTLNIEMSVFILGFTFYFWAWIVCTILKKEVKK